MTRLVRLRDSKLDLPAAWHLNHPWIPYSCYPRGGYHYVVGMCVLIRRKVFDTLGYHDELFLRCVDANYGVRAHLKGFSVGYVKETGVLHRGRMPTDGAAKGWYIQHGRELLYFLIQHSLASRKCSTRWREPPIENWDTWRPRTVVEKHRWPAQR